MIDKACEARMDPIEDMPEKKTSSPRSGWVASHDDKHMASRITISCLGDGSYINSFDQNPGYSQGSRDEQGWARC